MSQYPENYNWLMAKFSNVLKAHQELGKNLHDAGPLGEKEAQLIQLAAAAAVRSQGAVHSHCKRALAAGATPNEIYHAIVLLTSTIGFPTVAAALSWAKELIEK